MDLSKLDSSISQSIPKSIAQTIQLIQCANASYIEYNSEIPLPIHEILNVESYLHVTSPIRRIVDIINMGLLQESLGLSQAVQGSYNVDKINIQSQAIKRVQNKCKLLDIISNREDNEEILEGYVISVEQISNNLDQIEYKCQIYIQKYNLQVKVCSLTPMTIYSKYNLKLYLFTNANTLDKKIKAEIID
jgi:exoribonuclease R